MKVIKVDYDYTYDLLNEIMVGKTVYDKVIRENLDDNITDESKEKILNRAVDDQFYDKLPHTIVLLDDAMNILGKKKHEKLYNLLYQNRQPRFLICACIQDSTGIQCQFKRNSDSIWIFGGNANKRNFYDILRESYPDVVNIKNELWEEYSELSFDKDKRKTEVKILYNDEIKSF
jgi:hypothetical protein